MITLKKSDKIIITVGIIVLIVAAIGIAAYTGTCTSLSYLDCDIDLTVPPDPAELVLSGLTQGDTLYIRMWV